VYRSYICDKRVGSRNRIALTFTVRLSVIVNSKLKCNFHVRSNAAERISENYLVEREADNLLQVLCQGRLLLP
jgi:hypothetical protein